MLLQKSVFSIVALTFTYQKTRFILCVFHRGERSRHAIWRKFMKSWCIKYLKVAY